VYLFSQNLNFTIANARHSQKQFADHAQAPLVLIAVTMLSKLARNNAEQRQEPTTKREFASPHQTVAAKPSQRINAQLQQIPSPASSQNSILAKRDVLLQLAATQSPAKMLVSNVAQMQLASLAIMYPAIWRNMRSVLSRKPKDVKLMNSQPARKLVVSSNIVQNVTTLHKRNAADSLENRNAHANPKSVQNVFKKKLNSVKNIFAIPQPAAREHNFFVTQKNIARTCANATSRKPNTALEESTEENISLLQNVSNAFSISVDQRKEIAIKKTLENALKFGSVEFVNAKPSRIVMENLHAWSQKFKNANPDFQSAGTIENCAMTTTNAPMMSAMRKLVASTFQRAAMTTTCAPLILAMQNLDAKTPWFPAMMELHAQLTNATLQMENASIHSTTLFALPTINAQSDIAHPQDANSTRKLNVTHQDLLLLATLANLLMLA
jgi:hypothetical protein